MENIKQLITEEDGFYDTDLEKDDLIKLLFHYEEINGKMLKQNKKFKELFVKKSREVKKLKEENKKLEEFKKKAEEECEASAVMESMMDRIEKVEKEKKELEEDNENIDKRRKFAISEGIELVGILLNEWKLTEDIDSRYANYTPWWKRMRHFYNSVILEYYSFNSNIEWNELLEEYGITYDSVESIVEFFDDGEHWKQRQDFFDNWFSGGQDVEGMPPNFDEEGTEEFKSDEFWNTFITNNDVEDELVVWYLEEFEGYKHYAQVGYDGFIYIVSDEDKLFKNDSDSDSDSD